MKLKKPVNPFSVSALAKELDLFLSECSQWLEENSHHIVRGCAGIAITLILFLLLLLVLRKAAVPLIARKRPSTAETIRAVSVPFSLLVLWSGLSVSTDMMNLPARLDLALDKIFCALLIFTALTLVLHGVRCTADILMERLRKKDPDASGMNKLLLDLSHSLIRLAAWSLAVFFILQNVFMMNITHLLVSAGVLGLAIAFAAQNTVANAIASPSTPALTRRCVIFIMKTF